MIRRLLRSVRLGFLAGTLLPAAVSAAAESRVPDEIEPGIYVIPLRLPPSLESRRAELELELLNAQRRLLAFARDHGWAELMRPRFADSAVIFGRKPDFDRALLLVAGMDTTLELPATYCAALEQRTLLCVAPEIYARVYPQGVEDRSFEKLLAHEMAHRLHVRILKGDEEAMGPVWFYEGFAIHAAGQFSQSATESDSARVWEIVNTEERRDYRRYGSAIRFLLQRVPLRDLVAHAGSADFKEWLRPLINGATTPAR